MSGKRVSIVTDGAVKLSPDCINEYKIIIVPRPVKVGKQILKSNRHTTLKEINRKIVDSRRRATVFPPNLQHFLTIYRKLHAHGHSMVSIHAPQFLDDACHQALLARNMLLPDIELDIFETDTLDAGISFLVEAAARFARQRGTTSQQVRVLLQRLQDKIHTLLIASRPQHIPCDPPLDARQMLRATILGAQTLLSLEKGEGVFKVQRQSSGLIKELSSQRQLLPQIDGPCDILIKYSGYNRHLNGLRTQLTRLFKAENFLLEQAGVESYFLASNFIEINFLPTASEVSRIEQWVKMWG